ncbi:MAG: aminopeptidase family protein P, partial [Bacteroidales bacterium]|nr:aminopeptidase family protein P [Bacteroidales bacterium]
NNISLFICNNMDPYLNEQAPEYWKVREWLSGFSGSNGLLAVTENTAALWSDSRYVLQAQLETKGKEILFFNESLPDSPNLVQWIKGLRLANKSVIALDGRCFNISFVNSLEAFCKENGFSTELRSNPAEELWKKRPSVTFSTIYLMPPEYTGEPSSQKILSIRKKMNEQNADGLIVTALDDIAWCFNLRGNDALYSPIANACAYISEKEAVIFIHTSKATPELLTYLHNEGIIVADYDKWDKFISSLSPDLKICIDPFKCNAYFNSLISSKYKIFASSPIELLKSVKNSTEIEYERKVMPYDGAALCRLFYWIEKELSEGHTLYESQVADKIAEIRSVHPAYLSESFAAIVGYGANGAIVHYHPEKGKDRILEKDSLLLIDTGAHYIHGTTDITRTIALGSPTKDMCRDFTLVLKGHIALANVIFPEGTRGSQLDVLARQFLWKECMGYLHGTGHGIGYVLNVHEGPQNIRLEENPTVLLPGMLLSNEPGYYREGYYGIRCENTILVKKYRETENGNFLCFDTLSLYPFDLNLIDSTLLSEKERNWLNNYHKRVYEELSPLLNTEERMWLEEKTQPLP